MLLICPIKITLINCHVFEVLDKVIMKDTLILSRLNLIKYHSNKNYSPTYDGGRSKRRSSVQSQRQIVLKGDHRQKPSNSMER